MKPASEWLKESSISNQDLYSNTDTEHLEVVWGIETVMPPIMIRGLVKAKANNTNQTSMPRTIQDLAASVREPTMTTNGMKTRATAGNLKTTIKTVKAPINGKTQELGGTVSLNISIATHLSSSTTATLLIKMHSNTDSQLGSKTRCRTKTHLTTVTCTNTGRTTSSNSTSKLNLSNNGRESIHSIIRGNNSLHSSSSGSHRNKINTITGSKHLATRGTNECLSRIAEYAY